MKKKKPGADFWTILAGANVVTLVYPICLFVRAETIEENVFAALALIGSVFLLMVVDAVSIVFAGAGGTIEV